MSFEEGSNSERQLSEPDATLEHEEVEEVSNEGADEDGVGSGAASVAQSGEVKVTAGAYNAEEVNTEVFEDLVLGAAAQEVQQVWSMFLRNAGSRDAAAEAIYAAVYDAAPSMQSMFKTPRAVMVIRLMTGLSQIISEVHNPRGLKTAVEAIGFLHLHLEVTVPRVAVVRDAIVDLLQMELGDDMTPLARSGLRTVLNYVGGAYIFVRVKYAERLGCLASSWAQAAGKEVGGDAEADGERGEEDSTGQDSGAVAEAAAVEAATKAKAAKSKKSWFRGSSAGSSSGKGSADSTSTDFKNSSVPKTYNDMFNFNAAVMGFGSRTWMQEVLSSFGDMVTNASNAARLQEECDVLSLKMATCKGGVNFSEYKAVMLASLRSLVKDWGSLHEVSWSWLWDNIERMLKSMIGKPAKFEAALSAFLGSLDDAQKMTIRNGVYSKFFAIAPTGQDFFRQSLTRLHYIVDKWMAITLDMYRDPQRMVQELSALGLRHVGYGIPTELFDPFVTAIVQAIRDVADDEFAEESFGWSMSLVSRILVRSVGEGSTIVMKAINANSGRMLRSAVACAPRGLRAVWTLNVQVGTKSISPLMWAIEAGGLDAAKAIIVDLLTIRADRDRYYYGNDILFERHPDIIKRLCMDAPALLPVLLDGLIWRARITEDGQRRVNYYIKHLVVNAEGEFASAIEELTGSKDPKIVCHPVVSMVTDLVWEGLAFRSFLYGKLWFLFMLMVFVLSQSILRHLELGAPARSETLRISIFVCRCFIYICSLGHGLFHHSKMMARNCRAGEYKRLCGVKIPSYLLDWQELASLSLVFFLVMMLILEPILHCMAGEGDAVIFEERCDASKGLIFAYSVMSTATMLLYFLLLTDLSVISTRVSAYVLVCGKVLAEVGLFLFGLTFFVLAFACAICSLEQTSEDFQGIPVSGLNLYKMTFSMYSGRSYDLLDDHPALLLGVLVFTLVSVVFLTNLLIAQLSCAYRACYQDMLGFARLSRGKIVAETMISVPKARWIRFVESLRLDDRVEFGEGDIGLAGGLQIFEPAAANITTVDLIRRFGGTTSPAAKWPESATDQDDDDDRLERMEKLLEKAMKRMSGGGGRRGGGVSTMSGSGGSSVVTGSLSASVAHAENSDGAVSASDSQ